MAKIPNDGKVKVRWVPGETGIADITAPTTTELTATGAKDLQGNITSDGLDVSPQQATKDTATLDTTFDTTEPGRKSGSSNLTYFLDDDPTKDNCRTALVEDALGFLVIRNDGTDAADAFANGDKVEVFAVRVGAPLPVKVGPNTDKQRTSLCTFRAPWELDAVVGGS
jgi:hypothetical protein